MHVPQLPSVGGPQTGTPTAHAQQSLGPGVFVGALVGVGVSESVGVTVAVDVEVTVGVGVLVATTVGVGVSVMHSPLSPSQRAPGINTHSPQDPLTAGPQTGPPLSHWQQSLEGGVAVTVGDPVGVGVVKTLGVAVGGTGDGVGVDVRAGTVGVAVATGIVAVGVTLGDGVPAVAGCTSNAPMSQAVLFEPDRGAPR